MNLVRIGIVGLGYGAKIQLPAFLSLPDVEVVAVADIDDNRLLDITTSFEDLKAHNDWMNMIADDDIDAISVASPPFLHSEIVCAALASGKHVLCEKPFGIDLDAAMKMYEAVEHSNEKLVNAIDFEFRMEPGIVELKHLVDSGMIGQVVRIDVTWFTGGRSDPSLLWSWQHDVEAGGGVLEAFGSHIIDYVEWICQSPIIEVTARSHILINHRKGVDGIERDVTAEDSCDLICGLANGVVASLRFSNCYPFPLGHRIEIYGDCGRLIYAHEPPFLPGSAKLWMETRSRKISQVKLTEPQSDTGLDTRVLAFRELARRFADAVRGTDVHDLPSFACGLKVRKVLQAARVSLISRKQELVPEGVD